MIDQKLFYTFVTMDKEFLFFPCTLAIFKIDKEASAVLNKYANYITCYEEIVNELKEIKNEEEIELIESLLPYIEQEYKARNIIKENEKNKTLKKDIDTLQVNTSYSCNMRCKYCFAEDGCHGKSGTMKLEDLHKVYDFINKNNHNDEFKVVFVGGEPLINKKYVYEFINNEEECNANLSYIVITNGTLVDDKLVGLMKSKDLMLNVSIDSNDKKINDYLRPMQGENSSYSTLMDDKFVMMEDVKEKISINCTITKNNLYISEMFTEFYEKGFSKFHFQEVITENSDLKIDDKDADILIEE
ncbi:Radical SAM superfamily protein [Clostridium sp. DSM 8431]|uniref:radical SAM protein n=1 Tax=Clostridium sp. DSM 8431 TaxID=1761781 RepID=UPI0008F1DC08|nr:radical SAM protein [Clostridium sp. DSM 8431]SFU51027.1 Radical SAM superfamily protein [Clostridium sp. DSM 8431]